MKIKLTRVRKDLTLFINETAYPYTAKTLDEAKEIALLTKEVIAEPKNTKLKNKTSKKNL